MGWNPEEKRRRLKVHSFRLHPSTVRLIKLLAMERGMTEGAVVRWGVELVGGQPKPGLDLSRPFVDNLPSSLAGLAAECAAVEDATADGSRPC